MLHITKCNRKHLRSLTLEVADMGVSAGVLAPKFAFCLAAPLLVAVPGVLVGAATSKCSSQTCKYTCDSGSSQY